MYLTIMMASSVLTLMRLVGVSDQRMGQLRAIPTLTLAFMRHMWNQVVRVEMRRVAAKGFPAPNPTVLEMDTYKKKRLLDFGKIGRPLVVLFGSGT